MYPPVSVVMSPGKARAAVWAGGRMEGMPIFDCIRSAEPRACSDAGKPRDHGRTKISGTQLVTKGLQKVHRSVVPGH